jgi:HK97 gp10 family phage protein
MATVTVSIVGADRLVSKLDRLRQIELREVMIKATGVVESAAKRLVPVDTSALRGSIHASVEQTPTETTGIVATSKEYAAYVEFGTGQRGGSEAASKLGLTFDKEWSGQTAQPYLYPALKMNEAKIIKLFVAAVVKAAMKG